MTRKGRGKSCDEGIKEEEGKTVGKEGILRALLGIPFHKRKRMGKQTQDAFRENNCELEILANISPQRCL